MEIATSWSGLGDDALRGRGGRAGAREAPRGPPKRTLLGKIIVGVSVAFLIVSVSLLVAISLFYRHRLVEARAERLDLIAALAIRDGMVRARSDEDLIAAIERGVAALADELGDVTVVLVDGQGLALAVDGSTAGRAAELASELVRASGGLSAIERSVSVVEGARLVHLTPIRSQQGFLEGALLLDVPLWPIDARVASHMLLAMGGVLLLLVLTGLVVILVVYHHVLKPVSAITEANSALVEGDTERAIVPMSSIPDDELGDVISVRNEIYRRMLEYQGAIREQNKTLERQGVELSHWA
ncbi:hypothetical protein ACFL59_15320, partial [Planctomycetota bacterium]